MLEDISFLGSSQTFIGILATIVLLCIISDSNAGSGNFLYAILSMIIARTRDVVESHKTAIEQPDKDHDLKILETDFDNYIEKIRHTANGSEEAEAFIEKSTISFKSMRNSYAGYLSGQYFSPIFSKIQEIEDSKEQTLSPLFAFAFCIIMFICDEIWCSIPGSRPIICRFSLFFTSFSCVYLGLIWHKFNKEYKHIPSHLTRKNYPDLKSYHNKGKEACVLNIYFTYGIISLFLIVLVPGISDTAFICLILMTLCIAIYLTGLRHIRLDKVYGNYRHSFLFYHFCVITFLSLIPAIIFSIPFSFRSFNEIDYPLILMVTKWGMVLFIIFFGLISPFLFPYLALLHILDHAKEIKDNVSDDIKGEWARMNLWITNLKLRGNTLLETLNTEESSDNSSDEILDEMLKNMWYWD